MKNDPAIGRLLAILVLGPCAVASHAASDCTAQISVIDERIASGAYPQSTVELAMQMRQAIEQMCGYLDEQALNAMVDGINDLLPVKTEEELKAERRARAAELKAERDARARGESTQPAQVAPVLEAPPTARSLAARFIERADDMAVMLIWDWDHLGNRTRVLYTTSPSLSQLARPDWQDYVYVVELQNDGSSTQHVVTSKHASDRVAVVLRRGHDEIVFQRRSDDRTGATSLERWSIADGRLISAVATPSPVWSDGKPWDWGPVRLATSDGNVFFTAGKETARGDRSEIGWFEASLDGRVIGQGSMASDRQKLGTMGFFDTLGGGGGMVVSVMARDERGITSAIKTPIVRELNGREVTLQIGRETRLLVTTDEASSGWESHALERDILWAGLAPPAQELAVERMMQQQHARMTFMSSTDIEFDANRSIASTDIGSGFAMMIEPLDDGYAVLAKVAADRGLDPPVHGPWLLTVDASGTHKTAYLDPMAEALGVEFKALAVSPAHDVYVFGAAKGRGNDLSRVVRLDRTGNPKAHGAGSPAPNANAPIVGLTADDGGVWLLGWGQPRNSPMRLWTERIAFP